MRAVVAFILLVFNPKLIYSLAPVWACWVRALGS